MIYALDTKDGTVLDFFDKDELYGAALQRDTTDRINSKNNIEDLLTHLGGEWTSPSGIMPRYIRITAVQARKIRNGHRPRWGRWDHVQFAASPALQFMSLPVRAE